MKMQVIGLAGLGLFGVLSYAVVRRTPEFGLRMALGAQRSRVLWGVVRDALWLVMCGFLLGLPLVALGSNLVSALVFGVTPYDGISVLAALVVLLGVGGGGTQDPFGAIGDTNARVQCILRSTVLRFANIATQAGTP